VYFISPPPTVKQARQESRCVIPDIFVNYPKQESLLAQTINRLKYIITEILFALFEVCSNREQLACSNREQMRVVTGSRGVQQQGAMRVVAGSNYWSKPLKSLLFMVTYKLMNLLCKKEKNNNCPHIATAIVGVFC
jgi:hypothetical protein